MRYYNIRNISFQQIQIFLKAVELRNYTRVAEYLNFTVSMISKTISNMEKETGLILFLRQPRELVPTPAAMVLAHEWRSILYTVEQSLEKAHIAQNGARTMLNLGFIDSSTEMDRRVQKCLSRYEQLHPDIDIHVEKLDMHELVEQLHTGELDIICTAHHEIPALEAYGLPWKMLLKSHLAAYVPRRSPLFQRERIAFSDLRNEGFIIPSPVLHINYYTMFDNLCRAHGFSPRIAVTATNVRSMMYSLRLEKGVVLGDEVTGDWACDNVKQFVLPEEGGSILGWRIGASPKCMELTEFMLAYFNEK